MSYGILVQNSDNRVIIDETYSHIYPRIAGTASVGSTYPPTSFNAGDTVFASCNSSGYIGLGVNNSGQTTWMDPDNPPAFFSGPSAGYSYVIGSKMAGNLSSGSGYGLEVYNSSSQMVYTTAPYQFFRIIAAGSYAGTAANQLGVQIPFPNFQYQGVEHGEFEDLRNIYVLVNNTSHLRLYIPGFANQDFLIGYRYEYTTGYRGRVWLVNETRYSSLVFGFDGASLDYLIVEKI